MKYTENYGLRKPEYTDYQDIADLNYNADVIDDLLNVHKYRNLQVHLDGGATTIPTGWRGSIVVPINCTITGWYLLADASGRIDISVTKTTYSNYPTGSSILTPSLSSAQKGSASGLSISCSKDDILTVTVDLCSTIKFCELVLVTVVS
ncbi:MAG: hypothetical protein BPH43C_43 [Phage 5P_1]|nr:MAG: hypothetical protein BPH43C_43 [Phage 5P_1]